MARYTDAVCKLCRREGEKLFLKGEKCFTPKCPVERRPYAPGQHGKTSHGRGGGGSDYRITAGSCEPNRKHAVFTGCWNANSVDISKWL